VGGKITYPDGSPLSAGEVCFTDDKFAGRAAVQPDGTYKMGRIKDGDGIPRGTYKVFISEGAIYETPPDGGAPSSTVLVDRKFMSSESSGLTCTVEGETVFDFKVEKP
jgi:hypothetical protein